MPASPMNSPLRGATAPRVSVAPPSVDSYGSIACRLMAAAGKPLEQWQRDAMQIMLSVREDDRWACYEYAEWVSRQSGKGALGEARVLTGFLVLGEQLIIWTAHEYKTSHEAFLRMRALLRALGTSVSENLVIVDGVEIKIHNGNEEGFERLDTEQRVKFIARSKSSGRGFSGDCVIIDETFAYTPEQAEALGPTMIARPNAQIVYLSSPPLSSETGQVMYSLRTRAEKGGDGALGYRDWGLAGDLDAIDRINLDDRNLWAQAVPALGGGRVTIETIDRLRKMLSQNGGRGFAREVLGLWPKKREGGGFIDLKRWRELADPASQRAGNVAIAVDMSPKRDYACISMVGRREDGFRHAQILDYRPGIDWLVEKIVEWRGLLQPVVVAMGPGTGRALKVELKKHGIEPSEDTDEPKRGDLLILSAGEMGSSCGLLLQQVRDGQLRHIGQAELDSSIEGTAAKETGDNLVWVRGNSSADPSPTVSLSIALWGFDARSHLVDQAGEPFHIW